MRTRKSGRSAGYGSILRRESNLGCFSFAGFHDPRKSLIRVARETQINQETCDKLTSSTKNRHSKIEENVIKEETTHGRK